MMPEHCKKLNKVQIQPTLFKMNNVQNGTMLEFLKFGRKIACSSEF